jgi:trk system potassium uptake protein TrkH
VVVAKKPVPESALTRIAGMFVLYLALLLVGTLVTLVFHGDMGPFEAASGMFSALGNIGPWYVPAGTQLHAAVKLTYIFGMLAGRLEILPLLILADPKTWKRSPG